MSAQAGSDSPETVAREVNNYVPCIEPRGFERRERRWSGEIHVRKKRSIEPFEVHGEYAIE